MEEKCGYYNSKANKPLNFIIFTIRVSIQCIDMKTFEKLFRKGGFFEKSQEK